VTNEDQSEVSELRLDTGTIEWHAPTGPEPEGVAVSPDGKVVVVTAETSSTAHFLDAGTGKVLASALVGSRPRDALFLPLLHEIWVSSEQRGTITVFDSGTFKQKAVIDVVPAFPDLENVQTVEMELTRDGKRAFVAMGRGNRVAEIHPQTRQVVRSFPAGQRVWGLALSPDERRLYAAAGLSGELTIIDLEANEVIDTVELGGRPWGVEAVKR
jgi:YVTN family beta-propeller protein